MNHSSGGNARNWRLQECELRSTCHLRIVGDGEVDDVEPTLCPCRNDGPCTARGGHGADELRVKDVPPRTLGSVVPGDAEEEPERRPIVAVDYDLMAF